MKADPLHPQAPKKPMPLVASSTREFASFFVAAEDERLNHRNQRRMQLRRVAFTTTLDSERDSLSLHVDVSKGNACFGQAAALMESYFEAGPHPFRRVFKFLPDLIDLHWSELRLLPLTVELETEAGYGVRGDVAAIHTLIHDDHENPQINQCRVSAHASLPTQLRDLFARSPCHVFCGMVALKMNRRDDANGSHPEPEGPPTGLIFDECFRAIRIIGLKEPWNPLIEGYPDPLDQPSVFLLQGQLSNFTLACTCLDPDPNAVMRGLSAYRASFVAVLDIPVGASSPAILASHCAQDCAHPLESKSEIQKGTRIK